MPPTPKVKGFGPFSPAENLHGYAKVGIYGFQGGGKTFTSAEIARGLWERLKEIGAPEAGKPIAFVDSEKGSDFMVKKFHDWNIPFVNTRTKSFSDLMTAMEAAQGQASIVIVDSITLFWSELQRIYKDAKVIKNLERRGFTQAQIKDAIDSKAYRTNLTFRDWMPLKDEWGRFVQLFVNSPMHIIISGRAKWEYDFSENEDGSKEIEKTGSSMKVDNELSYEPSLLLEIRHEAKDAGDKRVDARFWDHVAYILKDRADVIDGQRYVNPTYKNFAPHFDYILGKGHAGVAGASEKDKALFMRGGESVEMTRERVKVLLEEIQGELVSVFPSQSEADKKMKREIILAAFHTHSWTAIENMTLEQLKGGLDYVRGVCQQFITKMIKDGTPPTPQAEHSTKKPATPVKGGKR